VPRRQADSPAARDERSHPPTGAALFTEAWTFVSGPGPGIPVLEVEVGVRPTLGDAWFTAQLTGPADRIVVIVDHGVEQPRGPNLELRAPGLWADHVLEEPLRRWSLGAEAFGVALVRGEVSDADLLDPEMRGERVPVGWELEWENDLDPSWVGDGPEQRRYAVSCHVTGEVLIGHDRFEVDAPGHRSHCWGPVSEHTD
jgi:hypothetical protein